MRPARLIVLGIALCLVLLFMILGVNRSLDVLDIPGDSLVMPPMDADVWYQGQGLPIPRALLREGIRKTASGKVKILPYVLSDLPYKNNEETESWVDHVNREYKPEPRWRFRPERRLGHYKCMSLSASTVRDWFRLRDGAELESYTSMLNGLQERGLNPKILDSLYYLQADQDPDLFPLTDPDHYDPVAGIPVPHGMRGFIKLLTDPPDELPAPDASLPGVSYEWRREELMPGYRVTELFRNILFDSPFHDTTREMGERVRDAIEERGILYAGIRTRFSASGGVFNYSRMGDIPLPFLTGHAVAIVGWIEQGEDLYFIYRETFGGYDSTSIHGGPAYRAYPVFGFSEIYSFQPP